MVGGDFQNKADLDFSSKILKKILSTKSFSGTSTGVIDLAGGNGRVAEALFKDIFETIDIEDLDENLVNEAKQRLGSSLRNIYPVGIEGFKFSHEYDLIWIQWGLCFIQSDEGVVKLLKRAVDALVRRVDRTRREVGRIVIIENIASGRDLKDSNGKKTDRWVDPEAGIGGPFGVIRSDDVWTKIMNETGAVWEKILNKQKFSVNEVKKAVVVDRVCFIIQPSKSEPIIEKSAVNLENSKTFLPPPEYVLAVGAEYLYPYVTWQRDTDENPGEPSAGYTITNLPPVVAERVRIFEEEKEERQELSNREKKKAAKDKKSGENEKPEEAAKTSIEAELEDADIEFIDDQVRQSTKQTEPEKVFQMEQALMDKAQSNLIEREMARDDPMDEAVEFPEDEPVNIESFFNNRFPGSNRLPKFSDQILYTGDTFRLLAKEMTRHLIDAVENGDFTEGKTASFGMLFMKTNPDGKTDEKSVTRIELRFSYSFVNNNSNAEYLYDSVYMNLMNQLRDLYERYDWEEFDDAAENFRIYLDWKNPRTFLIFGSSPDNDQDFSKGRNIWRARVTSAFAEISLVQEAVLREVNKEHYDIEEKLLYEDSVFDSSFMNRIQHPFVEIIDFQIETSETPEKVTCLEKILIAVCYELAVKNQKILEDYFTGISKIEAAAIAEFKVFDKQADEYEVSHNSSVSNAFHKIQGYLDFLPSYGNVQEMYMYVCRSHLELLEGMVSGVQAIFESGENENQEIEVLGHCFNEFMYCNETAINGRTDTLVEEINNLIKQSGLPEFQVRWVQLFELIHEVQFLNKSGPETNKDFKFEEINVTETNRRFTQLINTKLKGIEGSVYQPKDLIVIHYENHASLHTFDELIDIVKHHLIIKYKSSETKAKIYRSINSLITANEPFNLVNFTLNKYKKKNLMKQIDPVEWIDKVNEMIRLFNTISRDFDPTSDSVIEFQLKNFLHENRYQMEKSVQYLVTDNITTGKADHQRYFFEHIFDNFEYLFPSDRNIDEYQPDRFNNVFGIPFDRFVRIERQIRLEMNGLMTLDCETAFDPKSEQGNQRVYMVSLYGRGRSFKDPVTSGLREINKLFIGPNAFEQLVYFMKDEGFILDINDKEQCLNFLVLSSVLTNSPLNAVYAHNGCGFDYRFLIDDLNKQFKVFVLGDLQSMKQIEAMGCTFFDSKFILSGKLSTLTKSFERAILKRFSHHENNSAHERALHLMYSNTKTSVKSENHDIVNYTWEMFVQDHINDSQRLKDIGSYCTEDSVSLFFLVLIFLETSYLTPYDYPCTFDDVVINTKCLPKTLFPLSTASQAMSTFLLGFETIAMYPNKQALEIEKSTYMGGLCIVFSTYGGLVTAEDINSSYAGAMINPQPCGHYVIEEVPGSDEKVHEPVTDDEILSRVKLETYVNGESVIEFDEPFTVKDPKPFELEFEIVQGDETQIDYVRGECLYKIDFEVDRREHENRRCYISAFELLSLSKQAIVEPTMTSSDDLGFNGEEIGGHWVWGIEIMYMIKMGFLRSITYYGMIKYTSKSVYARYCTELYAKRKIAKQNDDDVLELLYKLLMNSLYGKHAEKMLPLTLTMESDKALSKLISMRTNQCETENNLVKLKTYIKPLPYESQERTSSQKEVTTSLHELEIFPGENDKIKGVGSLVRVASYITCIGRLNLIQSINAVDSLNSKEFFDNVGYEFKSEVKICYTDTDSIYVDFFERCIEEIEVYIELGTKDFIEGQVSFEINEMKLDLETVKCKWRRLMSEQKPLSGEQTEPEEKLMDEYNRNEIIVKQMADFMQGWLINESVTYKSYMELKIFNPTNFESFELVDMIHQSELGRFKIEKIGFNAVFTAAKEYSMYTRAEDDFESMIKFEAKGKGVHEETLNQPRKKGIFFTQEKSYTDLLLESSKIFRQFGTLAFDSRANHFMKGEPIDSVVEDLREMYIQKTYTLKELCEMYGKAIYDTFSFHLGYTGQKQENSRMTELGEKFFDQKENFIKVLCSMTNNNQFRATGAFVTIKSIMKLVSPSTSKREIIFKENDQTGLITMAHGSFFDYELYKVYHETLMMVVKTRLMNYKDFREQIETEEKLYIDENKGNPFEEDEAFKQYTCRTTINENKAESEGLTILRRINMKFKAESGSFQEVKRSEIYNMFTQIGGMQLTIDELSMLVEDIFRLADTLLNEEKNGDLMCLLSFINQAALRITGDMAQIAKSLNLYNNQNFDTLIIHYFVFLWLCTEIMNVNCGMIETRMNNYVQIKENFKRVPESHIESEKKQKVEVAFVEIMQEFRVLINSSINLYNTYFETEMNTSLFKFMTSIYNRYGERLEQCLQLIEERQNQKILAESCSYSSIVLSFVNSEIDQIIHVKYNMAWDEKSFNLFIYHLKSIILNVVVESTYSLMTEDDSVKMIDYTNNTNLIVNPNSLNKTVFALTHESFSQIEKEADMLRREMSRANSMLESGHEDQISFYNDSEIVMRELMHDESVLSQSSKSIRFDPYILNRPISEGQINESEIANSENYRDYSEIFNNRFIDHEAEESGAEENARRERSEERT